MTSRRTAAVLAALLVVPGAAPAVKITEYTIPTPGSQPYAIAPGFGTEVWFTELAGNKIGKMTPTGSFTEFTIPTAGVQAYGIARGVQGRMIFTRLDGAIQQVSDSGTFNTAVTGFTDPHQVVLGPDGRAWFSDPGSGKVHALKLEFAPFWAPATAEQTGLSPASGPYGLAVNTSVNQVYIIQNDGDSVALCNGVNPCTELPLPSAGSNARRIAQGVGIYFWYTAPGINKIVRWNPGGPFTEFTIPTPNSNPLGITLGPDGNMWFTEQSGNKIGRITPAGVITEFPIPTPNSNPTSICTGADGNLYFTENNGNKIGKLEIHVAGDVNGDGSVTVADVFHLITFLFAGGPAPL